MKEFFLILKREVIDIFSSPAGLVCLGLQSFALGAGFYLAPGVVLPGEVLGALRYVFVPAFKHAYYLTALLLPLVVARALFRDNGGGALRYLGQVCGFPRLFSMKSIAVAAYLAVCLLLSLPAVFYWVMLGGSLPAGGVALLYAGFLLQCALAVAFTNTASSSSRSSSTAAGAGAMIMALLLSLDLLGEATGLAALPSVPSLKTVLSPFENGTLPVGTAAGMGSAIILLMLFSYCRFSKERGSKSRVYIASTIIGVLIVAGLAAGGWSGMLDRTLKIEDTRTSPGATVLYKEAVKAAGTFWLQSPAVNTPPGPETGTDGFSITTRDRRDILVLYWAVIPLVLLLIGAARGLGSNRMPAGRKKIIVMAGTWIVIMVSLALLQDYYFKNRTWKAFPSVREILPQWIGSVNKLMSPGPDRARQAPAAGRPRTGPVDPNCLYAGKDYEHLKHFFASCPTCRQTAGTRSASCTTATR